MGLQQRGLLSLEDLIDEVHPGRRSGAGVRTTDSRCGKRPRGAILLRYPDADGPLANGKLARASSQCDQRDRHVGRGGGRIHRVR